MKVIPASDSSLLVVFGNTILPDLQRRVLSLFHGLQALQDSRIRNLHPAYASLLIDYDPLAITGDALAAMVEALADRTASEGEGSGAVVNIPVCYDAEFGL